MDQAGRRAVELLKELNRIFGARSVLHFLFGPSPHHIHHTHLALSNFLWLGVQFSKPATLGYQHAVSTGLQRMREQLGINYAFVDTGRFFGSIEEDYGL